MERVCYVHLLNEGSLGNMKIYEHETELRKMGYIVNREAIDVSKYKNQYNAFIMVANLIPNHSTIFLGV